VYQISRSIYRRLAPLVVRDRADRTGAQRQRHVLEACEGTITRMATDRRYFAHPARSLFGEIRGCFSLNDQVLVYLTIEHHVELADEYLARLPENVTAFGDPRQCHACTRKGTPCRREPLPGRDYCPSHKQLGEPYVDAQLLPG
jgi:hypothetical protein